MKILPLKKWKVTFADGSYAIVDARSNYEAIKIAKPLSRFTTVHAALVIGWNPKVSERKMMKRNIDITSEMIKGAKGESSKLLEKLAKLDRNSKEARKIRRQLRKLGISLSKAVSREHLRKKVAEGERRRYIKKSIETPFMTKKERKRITKERIKRIPARSLFQRARRHWKQEGGKKISKRRIRELRAIEKKAQMELPLKEKVDQVLDTAKVLIKIPGYRSKSTLVKRLMEIYPRLTEDRANRITDQVLLKKNPPSGATEIYGKILAIEAQKGDKSTFPGERFRHNFKPGSKIFGLPDGSILIKGKKKLWRKFKY